MQVLCNRALEQEGSEWHGCTPPLIQWLITHSSLNKLLTGYRLVASPCKACSISRSHIVEAAAVGTVVFWKLMPRASAKWRLMACDLSRGWPSEHTHGGGCVPCWRPEPAISFQSVSISFLPVWVLCMQMSQVGLAASVQSQVHL